MSEPLRSMRRGFILALQFPSIGGYLPISSRGQLPLLR